MSIDFEVTQTLIALCSKPRTADEIASADYRELIHGLLNCSREELQLATLEKQSLLPCWGVTSTQRDELEALLDDLQVVRGFYARRLRVILQAMVALPVDASFFPVERI